LIDYFLLVPEHSLLETAIRGTPQGKRNTGCPHTQKHGEEQQKRCRQLEDLHVKQQIKIKGPTDMAIL
jgi:hypothetical protein